MRYKRQRHRLAGLPAENLIVLEFVAKMGFPGLMGIVTAAIVAAAMITFGESPGDA